MTRTPTAARVCFAGSVLLVAAVGSAACAGGSSSPPPAGAPALAAESSLPDAVRYRFAVDRDLSSVRAQVCFEGPPPARLVPGIRHGGELLRDASDVATGKALTVDDNGAIDLRPLGDDGCLVYTAELGSPRGAFGLSSARFDDAVVNNASLWLWRPRRYAEIADITARFEVPPGIEVAVAWPREGEVHRLDPSACAFYAHAVFGRFEREQLQASGAVFEVAVLDGLSAATRAAITPWLRHAAQSAVVAGERLPFDRAQIVVVPTPNGASPIPFGHTARGGGRSIALLVGKDASLEALRGDWTLVHELSHLYHPFVLREDMWLREGLATYYQELMRARAGTITDAYAWKRFWDGAAKGRASDMSLAHESARVFSTYDFPMVYWGGAAFALLADVELRQRSEGVRSLDEVMLALAQCCAGSPRPWSGAEVLARMDAIAGGSVFSDLAARVAQAPPFPDLRATFGELGIDPSEGGMRLLPNAPLSHVRDAIMMGSSIGGASATARR